jgi:acetyl-CoA carboxylase carboxyltransferase component
MSHDLHTTAGKIEDLRDRFDEAIHAGDARAVEKQHAKGKGTARERIEMLRLMSLLVTAQPTSAWRNHAPTEMAL